MKKRNRKADPLVIGFVMDPMETLDYDYDSSIALMMEAENRGHEVVYIEPKDIYPLGNKVFAEARYVSITDRSKGFRIRTKRTVDLGSLDAIVNRKDPPFDLAYLYLTQILELLEPKVFVMNSPAGLRKANEKLFILNFPDWIPPTLVTNQPDRIQDFQNKIHSNLIIKPLDRKGGSGIKLLSMKNRQNKLQLRQITQNGTQWVMAQKFIESVRAKGDKRILLLNGEVLGCFQRIPKKGEFRANLCLGGDYQISQLTSLEKKLVSVIAPTLIKHGLYFVGIDVIDHFLIEANVTSPAGITVLNELEEKRLEVKVMDFLEKRTLSRAVL